MSAEPSASASAGTNGPLPGGGHAYAPVAGPPSAPAALVGRRDELSTGLETFALIAGVINLVGASVQIGSEALFHQGGWDQAEYIREATEGLAQVALSAVVWLLAISRRVPAGIKLAAGALLYLTLVGISTYYDALYLDVRDFGVAPSWVCLTVLVYALLVPAPWPYHLTLATIASIALPAGAMGAGVFGAYGDVTPTNVATAAVTASMPTWICAGVALIVVRRALSWQHRLREVEDELADAERNLQRLGSYELERKLGEGGMGEVWLGTHEFLKRPAAIKLIRPGLIETDEDADLHGGRSKRELTRMVLARFRREARVTSRLTSPHTVQLFDYGQAGGGLFFYVMELLDGLDFHTLVTRFGRQPQARVVHLLLQACDSLAEAHRAGLVHRDIKPGNLFMCRRGEQYDFVKVLDFGLARTLDVPEEDGPEETTDEMELTVAGRITGTPDYMAPEQATHPHDVDHRADIYALGCVGWFLLTGRAPFDGRTAMEVIGKHMIEDPPPLAEHAPGVPAQPALEALLRSCLAKKVADRPASAADVADALRATGLASGWTASDARDWAESHQIFDGSGTGPDSTPGALTVMAAEEMEDLIDAPEPVQRGGRTILTVIRRRPNAD